MITAIFSPEWITPIGSLGTVNEGQTINFPLSSQEVATVPITTGAPNEIDVGTGNGVLVSRVEINGTNVPFTRVGDIITISALPYNGAARIILNRVLSYSILEGILPPGTGLVGSTILGTVANIPTNEQFDYTFTIRIANNSSVRDRRFSITATPFVGVPFWETETLPPLITDDPSGFEFRDLGIVERGASFGYTFGASSVDGGNSPPAELIEDFSVLTFGFFEGLPLGLTWNEELRRIEGVVSVSATPGRYAFGIQLIGPTPPPMFFVSITVSELLAVVVSSPVSITWVTSSGKLGIIREGDPCPFSVLARTSNLSPITYSIIKGTLPPGLALNAVSGEIIGLSNFTNVSKTYTFTIRARSGNTYLDRIFSIEIVTFFEDNISIANIIVRASGNDRFDLGSGYRARLVQDEDVFRINDEFFGFPNNPTVYLVGGLRANELANAIAGDNTLGIPRLDYHGEVSFILGGHRLFLVRNENNEVIYEVLFRELIDPKEGVGGFSYVTELPIENKARYPHTTPSVFKYIYENSVRNIRLDFIKDLGFANSDPSLRFVPGVRGGEALPTWMRSPQIPGDLTTASGFVLGYPVAFVKPGAGKALLEAAELDTEIPQKGRIINFGGYVSEVLERRATIFDENMKILPYIIVPGTTSINLGRYENSVEELVVIINNAEPTVWRLGQEFTIASAIATFAEITEPSLIYAVVKTDPVSLSPPPITSTNGAVIELGPFAATLISIKINGNNITNYTIDLANKKAFLLNSVPVNSEVVLSVGPINFDGTTTFEGLYQSIAKYVKLPGILGKLP